MSKFKRFDIVTELGEFRVSAPASKVTEEYAKVVALHWLQKQCCIVANEVRNIKGIVRQ